MKQSDAVTRRGGLAAGGWLLVFCALNAMSAVWGGGAVLWVAGLGCAGVLAWASLRGRLCAGAALIGMLIGLGLGVLLTDISNCHQRALECAAEADRFASRAPRQGEPYEAMFLDWAQEYRELAASARRQTWEHALALVVLAVVGACIGHLVGASGAGRERVGARWMDDAPGLQEAVRRVVRR